MEEHRNHAVIISCIHTDIFVYECMLITTEALHAAVS